MVERLLHTQDVTSSNLVPTTIPHSGNSSLIQPSLVFAFFSLAPELVFEALPFNERLEVGIRLLGSHPRSLHLGMNRQDIERHQKDHHDKDEQANGQHYTAATLEEV